MLEIYFEKISETYSSEKEIEDALSENLGEFKFHLTIHSAHHYSDLAHDYIEAACIGQQLSQFAERIDLSREKKSMQGSLVTFVLKPRNIEELSKLIYGYGIMYSEDNREANEDFIENVIEYRDKVEETNHVFPELVDDYYANFINGEYYEYDPIEHRDFFDQEFSHFPERRFGFQKSAFSKKLKQNFYSSIDSLIIPNSCDINLILKEYSGIENIDFKKSDFFAIGNITYLISDGFIIHFPFDAFIRARNCAWEAIESRDDHFEQQGSWMHGFLSFDRLRSKYDRDENFKGYPKDISESLLTSQAENSNISQSLVFFSISSYGDHILVKDAHYSYFFFGTDKLTIKELEYLGGNLGLIFNTAANLAGIHVEIKCPWEQLNDESFEDVCYDVIYYNPTFDNTTIRKMGKTRSRDGGRDIVVYTHSRPGKPALKYIFQCKYQKPGTSLSGSKVQDISDTIIQYSASGYGIMTNVVIDSTLYDKLDGISRTLLIEVEDFSVYKLERILAAYPQLKLRHFKL